MAVGKQPRAVSLLRSLGYFVPSYLVAVLGYLAVNAVAARMLETSGFAYFVVLTTATTLVGQLGLLGVHRSGLREAARTEDSESLAELFRGVRAVLRVPLPLASVACAAVVWASLGNETGSVVIAVLTGVLVYESGYQVVATNYLRGLGHVQAASLLSGRSGGALVAGAQAATLLGVAWLAPDSGLPGVMLGYVVGYALPLFWVGWRLRHTWRTETGSGGSLQDLRVVLKRDWRFIFSQSGGFLNSTVELWLAAAVLAPAGASLFVAAHRIARLLVIPATSLQVVFSPAIARLAASEDRRPLEALVRTASSVTTAVSGVLWIPLVVAPQLVLGLVFGSGFEGAAAALVLISTGYLLNAVSGMSGTTLSMAGHEGQTAAITWSIVVVRVVFGVVCASVWGVLGLAVSSAAMSVLYYASTWTTARRRLSVSTHATLRPQLSLLGRIRG